MEWICWLFPACVAKTIIYNRNEAEKKEVNVIREFCNWGCWVVVINILTLIIIMYGFGIGKIVIDAFTSLSFALKYLMIAIIIAIILPYVIELFGKYINVSIQIEKWSRKFR